MASRRRLDHRFGFDSHTVHQQPRRRPVLEVLEGRALLATFTVNSLGTLGTGSGDSGDLPYCINQANADNQANTIVFDSTLFSTPQTINTGPLELEDTVGTLTITGPAAGVTIGLSPTGLQVDLGVTASISGLTLAGGVGVGNSGRGYGGALANYGMATLTGCTISNSGVYNSSTGNLTLSGCTENGNDAVGVFNSGTANLTGCTVSGNDGKFGGGMYNSGTANLSDSTLSGNYAAEGVGLFNSGTGNLTLTGCTVSRNYSDGGDVGGGVFNGGTASLTGCTVSGNYGYHGGGLFNSGTGNMTLTGCTVSDNSAGALGGGVANFGTANLTGCTVSGNSAYIGGGVYNLGTANLTGCTVSGNSATFYGGLATQTDAYGYTGAAALTDTIVAGNTSGSDASDIGGLSNVSGSDNLVGTGGSGGLADGVDGNIVLTSLAELGLAPLGNYGGQTQTIALLPGSPALGACAVADYPGTTTPITTDQRGEPLDVPNPDIGAFQSQGFTLTAATGSTDQSAAVGTAFANPLVVTVVANNEVEPVAGGVLTFAAPAAGPSATLSATTVTIGVNGVVSVTATANSSAGSYTVTAVAGGGNATVDFGLTNTTGSNNGGSLATFTVNTLGDALSGSGDSGDLRYCINEANADDGPNQIVFDPTVFSTPQTITLSLGQLELSDTGGTQTITGPAVGVTISGGGNSRVFQVDAGVTASISGVTISGSETGYPDSGAGLANYGTATLAGCTVSGNSVYAASGAAGVFNSGGANLTMTDCTVSGNYGSSTGGLANNGTANMIDCTLSGNFGSGLLNYSEVNLTGCTVSGNSAAEGGGVFNFGTANLTDCTVSGNSAADSGGGVSNYGTANLTGCTVSGNSSSDGGGLASYGSGPANLIDTIVAGNTDSSGTSDIGGSDVSGSDNLIGTGGSGVLVNGQGGNIVLTSLTGLDLAPLGNNGGPTQTMALLPGSPAIGAGVVADYPGTSTPITTDQRGEPRDSPNPDIGAFQTQGSTLTSLSFSGINDQSITYGTSSVTISGTLSSGSQAPVGETVAVTLNGDEQSPTIGSGGAFSTTFNDDDLEVASSPYTVSYAYTSDGSFESASTTSTLTVMPATLTITAKPETKVYGTADPALAYTAGGLQFNDTAGSVLIGALARAESGTLAGEQAGGYAISQGTLAADSNYTISFAGNTLTITPASLTVTANTQTKVYGTADPSLTDTATGFVDATVDGVTIDDTATTALTGHLARTPGETVSGGPYAINQGTLAASDYTITFTAGTLAITPAPLTVTANTQTKVYGTADPSLTDTATGFVDATVDGVTIDDTATTALTGHLARTPGETVSGGPYAINQGTLAASDYTITFTAGTLAITPAPLTVTANTQTKVYGTADPSLTDTATGFVDATVDGVTIDDTATTALTGHLARTPGETVSGGPYAINQGTLAASNYTITFAGGTLTITPAKLLIVAEPETKVFGSADPTLAYTSSGFQFSDTAATVLTGLPARVAGETVPGGPYAITQGTLAASSNYTITFTGSTLTITPAPLAVTANTQTKVYGTADPTLTDTATGFVDTTVDGVTIDDTAATALTGHLTRTPGETVSGGPYAITQGTLAANSNYMMTFTAGTLSITPAPVTVAANPQTKVYGTADPTLTNTATGFVDATVDGVTIDDTAATALSGHLTRTSGETVSSGPYEITQGTLAASNYTIAFTGSTLTITPAPLAVTANPHSKVYGDDDPALTVTPAGLVDTTVDGVAIDDTAATVLTGAPARAQAGTLAGEQVGDYAIDQGTLAAISNYTISFTAVTLTITPATLTVTADPETKVFGSADPALAYTARGFQFDDTAATVLSGHLGRATGETVPGGPYAITQGALAADGNYTIHFTVSALTITPATPPVSEKHPGGTYTGAPIGATATVTGVGDPATGDLEGVTPTLTYFAGSGTSGTNLGPTAPSAAETYTVVARFSGSADYAAAVSQPATFTIAPARATIVLEPHAVLKGKKVLTGVELTAAIEPMAPGGGVPTGAVIFEFVKKHGKRVKVTTLGTAALFRGAATLTFKPNKVLNKPLTIIYSGDPDFLASMMNTPKLTRNGIARTRI